MNRGARPEETARLRRGVRRHLADLGAPGLDEFSPARGLRADVFAITRQGEIWIIEIKSGVEDFRADHKWRGYLDWCDRFFFAVGEAFPLALLPQDVGVMRADAYGAEILIDAPLTPLAAARRKALTLRAARDAAHRLLRIEDPGAAAFEAE